MKVLQVIRGFAKVSGVATFAQKLSEALLAQGVDVMFGVRTPSLKGTAAPNRSVPVCQLTEVLSEGAVDVIHVHGLWEREVFLAARWAMKHHVPYVWSPHGMLAPWSLKYHWWKKFFPWHLYLKRLLKNAAAIHVTAALEKKWIEDLGFGPVVVAPLGTGESLKVRKFESLNVREFRVLFVGRVHPVKGLENLVRAVERVQKFESSKVRKFESLKVREGEGSKVREFEGLKVRIVGPDDGNHLAELKSLCDQLHLAYEDLSIHSSPSTSHFNSPPLPPSTSTSHFNSPPLPPSTSTSHFDFSTPITFVGPKYGPDLSAEYDNCDVFVLPSFTENFGGVVIDALAHGKPVIASKFTPWQELENVEGVQGEDKSKLKVEVEERRLTSELSPQVDSPSPSTSHFASPSRCGWWVDNDPETLAKTLREAMALSDEERRRMGEVGRRLVEAKYTWSAVAKKMIECYNNLRV